jgi:uncharacterized protein YdiU (UPF0061 family)
VNAPELLVPADAPAWRDKAFLQGLGEAFGTDLPAQPLAAPHWVARSEALARSLGLADWLASDAALAVLSGAQRVAGAQPHASVYSGHQFGVWAGQLGDGRALMLGEIDTPAGPMEVQLKGSGLTPYSRMGDGRAVLRSSIREFLGSEAMAALGIPTTRALAVIGSPLPVYREAVVTRIAPSFLRFGHFEHFAHTAGDRAALQQLLGASIERYFPELHGAAEPAAALLQEVARRTARLLAQWQAVGFCHGVMNTDNMSLLGLTIDYGPFGFLDGFDPSAITATTRAAMPMHASPAWRSGTCMRWRRRCCRSSTARPRRPASCCWLRWSPTRPSTPDRCSPHGAQSSAWPASKMPTRPWSTTCCG